MLSEYVVPVRGGETTMLLDEDDAARLGGVPVNGGPVEVVEVVETVMEVPEGADVGAEGGLSLELDEDDEAESRGPRKGRAPRNKARPVEGK